ncbi:MAG TPA: hypothetical protein PKG80_05190, partial [Acidobacteriota bacterium]|nr:hypothetical protein [Acidobacteriota bacterium]
RGPASQRHVTAPRSARPPSARHASRVAAPQQRQAIARRPARAAPRPVAEDAAQGGAAHP